MSIVTAAARPLGPPPSTNAGLTVVPVVNVAQRPLSISWQLVLFGLLAGSVGNVAVFAFFARLDPWTVMAAYNVVGLSACTVTRRVGWGVGFLLGTAAGLALGVYLLVQSLQNWTF